MSPFDMESFNAYSARHPEDGLSVFEYDYDYRRMRRAIADATVVVTMKHHPIVFAVGEDVPVVALCLSQYYVHKNAGALGQYGIGDLYVDMDKTGWQSNFKSALEEALKTDWFVKTVESRKDILVSRKKQFLSIVDSLLGRQDKTAT